MKYQLLFKFLAIAAISIVLLMALGSISYKVYERDQYRSEAKASIANGWSGSQVVVNPVMRVNFSKSYEEEVFDKNLEEYVTRQRTRNWSEWFIPDQLRIHSEVKMQERYLGIYSIPVYEATLSMEGEFSKKMVLQKDVRIKSAHLLSSFQDMRGISNSPSIVWNGKNVEFQPGDKPQMLGNYIYADISNMKPAEPAKFKMRIRLRGLDALNFVPAAKQVVAKVESSWPHPYFEGRYLPTQREIGEQGFHATWELTEFATSVQSAIADCQKSANECATTLYGNTFGVGMHNPIDVYQKTDRSLKYGFLFIALTFAAFLLFEVIKRIQIHPIQYGLVGAALAIFYLLLISLSEHIEFALAYLLAAGACVALIGFYLRSVLGSGSQALMMSAGMGLLYALLYLILRSEDFALLMGALLTFASLGALMIFTRKLDWYQLIGKSPATTEEESEIANKPG
ncbi:MAG: cell envelope integrity protein CreD [Pseudomonadota bacterium]